MFIVPDISAIIALAFDDEDSTYAASVLDAIAESGARVPTLFWFELRNVLLVGERRKRLTPKRTSAFLADLAVLPIAFDTSPSEPDTLDLARRHALSVYDAAYLELAQRTQAPLATLDEALIKAARGAHVPVFGRTRKERS